MKTWTVRIAGYCCIAMLGFLLFALMFLPGMFNEYLLVVVAIPLIMTGRILLIDKEERKDGRRKNSDRM